MKDNQTVSAYLATKKIIKIPNISFPQELIERINLQRRDLSVENNKLVLCLLDLSRELSDIKNAESRTQTRINKLFQSTLYTLEKPWESEAKEILKALFGVEAAPFVAKGWEMADEGMYQWNYNRRSFRAPGLKELYFKKKVEQVKQLWDAWQFDLSLLEYAQYSNYFEADFSFVFAAAIDSDHPDFLLTLLAILQNEAEVGKVSRSIIKALLLCNKPEAWKAVKNLLLAAQRQEGLRQTILECLDETSIGAMKYMLRVAIDEDLMRFSSVVRALDVWTGMYWQALRASAVKHSLDLGLHYLEHPDLIPKAMESKNNVEVYMALWAQGTIDVTQCYPMITQLLQGTNLEKRVIACFFAIQTEIHSENAKLASFIPDTDNLWDIYWKTYFQAFLEFEAAHPFYLKWHEKAPSKPVLLPNKGFEWIKGEFSKEFVEDYWLHVAYNVQDHLQKLLPFVSGFSIANRERFVRQVLKGYGPYDYPYLKQKDKLSLNTFQQEVAIALISDRSNFVQQSCINALHHAHITSGEIPAFLDLLRRKNNKLRKSVTQLLLSHHNDHGILHLASELLNDSTEEVRKVALDFILHLVNHSNEADKAQALALEHAQSGRATAEELLILDELVHQNLVNYTKENGFGLYNPVELPPIQLPECQPDHYFYQRMGLKNSPQNGGRLVSAIKNVIQGQKKNSAYAGYSMPPAKVSEQLLLLNQLIDKHKDYEYEVISDHQGKQYFLAGNILTYKDNVLQTSKVYNLDYFKQNFPLADVWLDWYQSSGLDALDLFYIQANSYPMNIPDWVKSFSEKYFSPVNIFHQGPKLTYAHQLGSVIRELNNIYYPANLSSYCLEASIAICREYVEVYQGKPITGAYGERFILFHLPFFSLYFYNVITRNLSNDELRRLYQLKRYMKTVYVENKAKIPHTDINVLGEFWTRLNLTEAQQYELALSPSIFNIVTDVKRFNMNYNWRERYPELANSPIFPTAINRLLEVEFTRGEKETEASEILGSCQQILGMENLFKCIQALGNQNFKQGYFSYYRQDFTKQEMMSHLLKICFPKDTDTQEAFDRNVKALTLSDSRLVEVAMYAPQWRMFVQRHLGWEALDSAIWWLHAHSSTYLSAEKETEIARFSAIPIEEFNHGAVDVEWFNDIYPKLGKTKWKILYDAAKYIEYGNGHTLAKLYADVILTNVKITDVTKRIKEKRNLNYLRVYGLVPLSKTVPDKDLLNRYNYLQQFMKESKQFGSQKQASEKLAVSVALDNLARNAGYPDPIRLTWAMEGLYAEKLLENAQTLHFDDVSLHLQLDKEGIAHIVAQRKDKILKNIPARLSKDKKVIALRELQKQLKEQHSRTRKALEQAMVNQDAFWVEEINSLVNHPIVRPMIEKLVLRTATFQGWWKEGKLVNISGETYLPLEKEPVFIAHCTHLHESGKWSGWQRYCFQHTLQQPFKQVFRELYLPTADEISEQVHSKRYAGHQVQPKKALALLKGRGWTVDYDYGLQKVLHKEKIVAQLSALADWFSPSEVESPTLEYIEFREQKDYRQIPLSMVPQHVFSEVMRDVDLVVSVAHAGGVDPEASLSTVELRRVIAEESARLFKLSNVEFTDRHILIDGTMASYSIHLGSGVVHKQPGGYLNILAVHSQHRGRLFLPFVDEDPRTAEIISKMLLLAEDHKIQDPSVLRLIQR